MVGLDSPDDAGVYRLDEKTALIQTLDFLTPVTDSPYEFGQIAAANSLSDVYAMGGVPVTVMNIVCFPSCDLEEDILAQTLKGGMDKINESGATLVGGHSVDDSEFKYGLSVTGIVHPDRVLTNTGAKTGNVILLTKPIGIGIMSTAIKAGLAAEDDVKEAVAVMSMLNKKAAQVMNNYDICACTDVTGFGLAGHLLEVAKGSKKQILLNTSMVSCLKKVLYFAKMGLVPAGAHKNRKFFEKATHIGSSIDRAVVDIMFDPQTSGGLLIFIEKENAQACMEEMKKLGVNAQQIGEVVQDHDSGFLTVV